MNVFMIITINVKDTMKFKTYLEKIQAVASPYGAEIVSRGRYHTNLVNEQGHAQSSNPNIAIIVSFPSIEQLESWFNSEEYQEIVPLRKEAAEMSMTVYQAIQD